MGRLVWSHVSTPAQWEKFKPVLIETKASRCFQAWDMDTEIFACDIGHEVVAVCCVPGSLRGVVLSQAYTGESAWLL